MAPCQEKVEAISALLTNKSNYWKPLVLCYLLEKGNATKNLLARKLFKR